MLNGLHRGSLGGCVLLAVAVSHQLLSGEGILALAEASEVRLVDGPRKAVPLGNPALPFSENCVALLPIVLLGRHEFLGVIGLRLARTERFGDGQHEAISETHRLRLGYRNSLCLAILRAIGIGAARRNFGLCWLVWLLLVFVILHSGSLRLYRRSGDFWFW